MKLKLPPHFQARQQERGLSIDHIKKAIREPDTQENSFGGRVKVGKSIEDKYIVVIYSKEGFRDKKDEYIVITAYYLTSKSI